MELNQCTFLKLFELGPITSTNDSFMIWDDHITTLPSYYSDLLERNNSIVTGYENFFIEKGTVKLFPLKDFDFIGKHVVCQKCCQIFASKMSYRAHVGTSICVRTYNGPNLVYLNFKNRHNKRMRKKNKKLIEDLPHYMKKNLLNPEMLNTLQTRNNCYSDVIHRRNKVKEKQKNGSDDPSVKKPRGRPKKIIEVKPKKRGRPKKLKTKNNNLSQKDNSSFSSLKNDEIMSKESSSVDICSDDDAYNNNVNEAAKLKLMYTRMKSLVEKCYVLLNSEWHKDTINRHQSLNKQNDQIQCNTEEKRSGFSKGDKHLSCFIESLKNDLKFLSLKFQKINDECSFKKDLDLMLFKLNEKHDEYEQKKTDISNGLTTSKGKENMHSTIEIDHETDRTDMNNTETYSDHKMKKVENSIKLWIKQCESVISHEECRNKNIYCDEVLSNSDDSLSSNDSKTSDNITSSMNNHSVSIVRSLNCGICDSNFASIAEWKMHYSEHMAKKSSNFLCKLCGHRFKVYKNYIKHIRVHEAKNQSEQERKIIDDKKHPKRLSCKLCGREYNYLKSYFAHIKTHV